MMIIRLLGMWAVLSLALSGCTIKATTDTTTDGTTEFVSSTTGRSWWTADGLVKQGHAAEAFISANQDQLLQDIAKGDGEYLFAFGHILHVPPGNQEVFAHQLQAHFSDLPEIQAATNKIPVKQFLLRVNEVLHLSVTPGLRMPPAS